MDIEEMLEEFKSNPPVAPVPGYTVHCLISEYYGSHPEYNEGDELFFVAIPEGQKLPDIRLTHGHRSRDTEDLALLPAGSFFSRDGEEWDPVVSWRRPIALDQPLLVPEGFVAVEATIQRGWEANGSVYALLPVWKKMKEGKKPIVHTLKSLSHCDDVEYVERRSESEHWWAKASVLATD